MKKRRRLGFVPRATRPKCFYMSGGGNLLPKFMPILFFRRVSRFEVFQEGAFKEMLAVCYLVYRRVSRF